MLITAKKHFDEDVERAKELLNHAESLPEGSVRDDIVRSSWMMSVGAADAYFCDAYADLIARTLQAKHKDRGIKIPDRLNNLRIPVVAAIHPSGGWGWRMAARGLIENQSVLSLAGIKNLFNHFFQKSDRLLNVDTIGSWIDHRESKYRLFGFSRTDYRKAKDKRKLNEQGLEKFEKRMKAIFQRRHDYIHNCDRPKVALQGHQDRRMQKGR